jgi:26S proteasome regulatory subunit N11
MDALVTDYIQMIKEEGKTDKKKLLIKNVGKIDPKRHLEQCIEENMTENVDRTLGMMLNKVCF